ncbi:UEV domain-containing protein, partial [Baffinella frigidus]
GSKFLKLEGTVQMYYQNQGYYVPLAVFLRADHPQNPPVCIVTPTPDMMIKPNHNHVDVQGVVYLPYLHTWNASGSSVIEVNPPHTNQHPPIVSSHHPPTYPPPYLPSCQPARD